MAFVPARKPPVAAILHHQSYQQHQATTAIGHQPPIQDYAYDQAIINNSCPTRIPINVAPPVLAHQPPHHHHHPPPLPVQNVHVQNIQAQTVQVQNVLVQPSANLDQSIQAQNLQLQTLQPLQPIQAGASISVPYSGVQIQNIGGTQTGFVTLKHKTAPTVKQENCETDFKTDTCENNINTTSGAIFQTQTIVSTTVSESPTFQLPVVSSTPAHSYIMAYSHPTDPSAQPIPNHLQILGTVDATASKLPVLVSQPMLVNLEPAISSMSSSNMTPQHHHQQGQWTMHPVIFSTNNGVCCLAPSGEPPAPLNTTPEDMTNAKTPHVPLIPQATQLTHHSPQLPAPSPNYPVQSEAAPSAHVPIIPTAAVDLSPRAAVPSGDKVSSEVRPIIPNRQVPILNNNYLLQEGNSHHFELASQVSLIPQTRPNIITNDTSVIPVTTSTVTIVSTIPLSHPSESPPLSSTSQALQMIPQTRDYESLITVNQIVSSNSTLSSNTVAALASTTVTTTLGSILSTGISPHYTYKPPITQPQIQQYQQPFTVLNVPVIPRAKPENSKPLVSKLDMATARRRERRLKRLQELKTTAAKQPSQATSFTNVPSFQEDSDSSVYSSSDSECDDSTAAKIELWITKGPPDKPDYRNEKLRFLKIFGLTTPHEKNGKFTNYF